MTDPETTVQPRWWNRLEQAVRRTREQFIERLDELLEGEKQIAPELFAELEGVLLGADLGVETTAEILARLRDRVERKHLDQAGALRSALREEIATILRSSNHGVPAVAATRPLVVLLIGVNGTGKTTTVAKLAYRWQKESRQVLLCAADTFRAAAGEQLEVWAERLETEILRQKPGADPSAVLFDAITAAKSRGADAVLVDTAGRLHTKSNLLAELEKMKRTAARLVEGAPQEILLVLDATTGQNGLAQARQFTEHLGVTGIVLTKLDGTAKGGIVVAIARSLRLPIRYLGVGEKLEDLLDFDPEAYVTSLFD